MQCIDSGDEDWRINRLLVVQCAASGGNTGKGASNGGGGETSAMDPVAVDEFDHGQAVFLGLHFSLEYATASLRLGTTYRVISLPY